MPNVRSKRGALHQVQLHQFDRGELDEEEAEASVIAEYEAQIAALERKAGQLRVSHNWMRFAETPYVRCASRRPVTPFRMSWQSCSLNGVECRRYGPRDFMSLHRLRPTERISSSVSPWSRPRVHSTDVPILLLMRFPIERGM